MTMSKHTAWRENIWENLRLVEHSAGPRLVTVVSGGERDSAYWRTHIAELSRDLYRADGGVQVLSVAETTRKGNFLGTLNAWASVRRALATKGEGLPPITLITMVFGRGTRLSPFTQALGNRKPAFPVPMRSRWSENYLCTADLSGLCTNLWNFHLEAGGFQGAVVKWGDEAIIPGRRWSLDRPDLRHLDAVRFVWRRDATEDMAREKEWVAIETRTRLVRRQYARQQLASLRERLSELEAGRYEIGVNLGSLAISYEFLEIALDLLGDDVRDPQKWADWDPYVWMALLCRSEAEWRAEAEYETRIGKTGLRELEARYPGFYTTIAEVRSALESRTGRPFAVGCLDFGEPFWADLGLHIPLRRLLESVASDAEGSDVARELFGIPQQRDERGNVIVRSTIPDTADVRDSVIIDTVIRDPDTVVRNGLIVGGRHGRLRAPYGGAALFCSVDDMSFTGPHAIALRSAGKQATLPAGGRHTTLLLGHEMVDLVTHESVVDYGGDEYNHPILGNKLSFAEAEALMANVDPQELENSWQKLRQMPL